MMMFDNDEDDVATVMTKLEKSSAEQAETNMHHEMMLVTIDMTVLQIAEMIVNVKVISITMVTAKVTVMMVASPPDNDLVVDEVFHGDGSDDGDDGDKNEVIIVN